MLLLAEQLFLLSIDRKTNKPYGRAATSLPYSLSGALLAELMLEARVELRHSKIVAVHSETEDPLLNETLSMIHKKKQKTPEKWVYGLQRSHENIQRKIGTKLDRSGVLTMDEKRFLGIFPSYAYHYEQGDLITLVHNRFKTVLQKHQRHEPLNKEEERTIVLMSLIHASNLLRIIFPDRKEARQAEKQIKHLNKDLPVSKAVKATIDSINAAVIVAVSTAVAASSSSNSS